MIAKVAILCAIVVAVYGNGLVNTGASTRSRHQDSHGNYAFGYDIVDGKGATNSRAEVGDGYGNKKGSYTLKDIDGRARRVDYVADKLGFRASVKTNEPGTAHSAPAAAFYDSPYGTGASAIKHIAPAVNMAATAGHGVAVGYGAGLGAGMGAGYGAGLGMGLGAGLGGHGMGLGVANGLLGGVGPIGDGGYGGCGGHGDCGAYDGRYDGGYDGGYGGYGYGGMGYGKY